MAYGRVDQRRSCPEASRLPGGPCAGSVGGWASVQGLRGEKLNLAEDHFVPIDQWGQAAQLITYETNNGNLEGPRLALSSVPKP